MKFKQALMAIMAAVLIVALGLNAAEYVPGELIVKFEHGVIEMDGVEETPISQITFQDPEVASVLQTLGVQRVEKLFKDPASQNGETFIDVSQVCLIQVDPSLDMNAIAVQLSQLDGVIYAEPNNIGTYLTMWPIDADFGYESGYTADEYQWALNNEHCDGHWDINALKAWCIETGDPEIKLAIVDAGITQNNIFIENGEFYGRVIETWAPQGENVYNDGGHGSCMAGIAAGNTNDYQYGLGNQHGTAGVAGGWGSGLGLDPNKGVELFIAKNGTATNPIEDYCIQAINESRIRGAHVLNGSWDLGPGYALHEAVQNAFAEDMTLFFASGGQGQYNNIPEPAKYAAYDICCAVGAIDTFGLRPPFSDYGYPLSFVAPGTFVHGPWKNPEYYSFEVNKPDPWPSGTSPSSALASGVGALIYSVAQDVFPPGSGIGIKDVDCKRIMEYSARQNYDVYGEDEWNVEIGHGCVDPWEALRHFYWPYVYEQGTETPFHEECYPGITVHFDEPPMKAMGDETLPEGNYVCDKYLLRATKSYGYYQDTEPFWIWGRILDGAAGYSGDEAHNDAWFQIDTANVGVQNAWLETYVYHLTENPYGQAIDVWAPRHKDDVEIAYTIIRQPYLNREVTRTPDITDPITKSAALVVDVSADKPNDVHLVFPKASPPATELYYTVDGFDNWHSTHLVDNVCGGVLVSIDLDSKGLPHIAYDDYYPAYPLHAWKDENGIWHNHEVIDPVRTATSLDIVASKKDDPIYACYCTDDGLIVAMRRGTSWIPYVVDDSPDEVLDCAITLDKNEVAYISYQANYPDRVVLRCARIEGPPEDWDIDEIESITDPRLLLCRMGTDITIDHQNRPVISYNRRTCTGSGGEIKCATRLADNVWDTEIANYVTGNCNYTSIAIDFDGQPVIYHTTCCSSAEYCKRLSDGWHYWDATPPWDDISADNHSLAIDNLGRLVYTYSDIEDGSYVKVRRRKQLPQYQSGGMMMSSGNAAVKEEVRPLVPFITAITPNPTAGSATINYHLPYGSIVNISIYDVTGRAVKTLVSSEQPAGTHEILWQGHDNANRRVSTGVYFVRMETENYKANQKITLIR